MTGRILVLPCKFRVDLGLHLLGKLEKPCTSWEQLRRRHHATTLDALSA